MRYEYKQRDFALLFEHIDEDSIVISLAKTETLRITTISAY